MKKTVSIVFALLLVAMLFVSCSGGNDGSADEGTAAPGESAAGDNGEIAVILQTYNGSFWSDVMRGIDTATEELKDEGITVNFNGPDDSTNLQAQIELIEAAVARDVIALAVAPADAAAVGNVMPRCEEKNIPVVTFDVNAESDWPVCLVSSDNYKLGQLAGQALGAVSYTHLIRGISVTEFALGAKIRTDDTYKQSIMTILLESMQSYQLSERIWEIDLQDTNSIIFQLSNGMKVNLGQADQMEEKMAWLHNILEELEAQGLSGGTIDLSSVEAPTYLPPAQPEASGDAVPQDSNPPA